MQSFCNEDLEKCKVPLGFYGYKSNSIMDDAFIPADDDMQNFDEMDISKLGITNNELDDWLMNPNYNKSIEDILSNNASPIGLLDEVEVLQWNLGAFIDIKSDDQSDESSTSSTGSPSRNDTKFFVETKENENSQLVPSLGDKSAIPTLINDNKDPKLPAISVQKSRKQILFNPISNKAAKVPIKRIPIKPKSLFPVATTSVNNNSNTNGNILIIKNELIGSTNVISPPLAPAPVVQPSETPTTSAAAAAKMLVFDNVNPMPINTYPSIINPVQSNRLINNIRPFGIGGDGRGAIDPKLFKRQQRKIKNRESACLSRKKKKDYLNSLEDRVKELSDENTKLKKENYELHQRLSLYEDDKSVGKKLLKCNNKPKVVTMFAFIFFVSVNMDIFSNPFLSKSNTNSTFSSISTAKFRERSLLWDDSDEAISGSNSSLICPASINQSESARLLLDLKRWIDQPKLMQNKQKPIDINYYPVKYNKIQRRRKVYQATKRAASITNIHGQENQIQNELEVFHPKAEQLYSDFFEAINRRDDTFYVVSFSEQHLLIPALYHNKTSRPKMSLLMASVIPGNVTSNHTHLPLMQIDCEVLDTKSVSIKYGDIPSEYRQYNNVTKEVKDKNVSKGSTERKKTSRSSSSSKNKNYKPYVLKN